MWKPDLLGCQGFQFWTTPSQCWISIRIAARYGSWTSRVAILIGSRDAPSTHVSVFHRVLFPKEERGILLCCEEEWNYIIRCQYSEAKTVARRAWTSIFLEYYVESIVLIKRQLMDPMFFSGSVEPILWFMCDNLCVCKHLCFWKTGITQNSMFCSILGCMILLLTSNFHYGSHITSLL